MVVSTSMRSRYFSAWRVALPAFLQVAETSPFAHRGGGGESSGGLGRQGGGDFGRGLLSDVLSQGTHPNRIRAVTRCIALALTRGADPTDAVTPCDSL